MSQEASYDNGKILLNAQYIKDLSFENPNAPRSLIQAQKKPEISLAVEIEVAKKQENIFEVSLHITAKAYNDGEDNIFLLDLLYGGLFTFQNMNEEQLEPLLMVYCPNMLFPYARNIISDISGQGGFVPLYIEPINFLSLYQRNKRQAA